MEVSLCVEPKIIYQNTSKPWDPWFRALCQIWVEEEVRDRIRAGGSKQGGKTWF